MLAGTHKGQVCLQIAPVSAGACQNDLLLGLDAYEVARLVPVEIVLFGQFLPVRFEGD